MKTTSPSPMRESLVSIAMIVPWALTSGATGGSVSSWVTSGPTLKPRSISWRASMITPRGRLSFLTLTTSSSPRISTYEPTGLPSCATLRSSR
jgi:hypothetical protein